MCAGPYDGDDSDILEIEDTEDLPGDDEDDIEAELGRRERHRPGYDDDEER